MGLEGGYSGLKGILMKIGEANWEKGVNNFLTTWENEINSSAKSYNIDKNLLKAIFKEEISHSLPLEFIAENYFDMGATIGPGQINIDVWENDLQTSREALKDIQINISLAAEILQIETNRLKSENIPATPQMIGTRYNSSNATSVSDYGLRINNFYNEFFTQNSSTSSIIPESNTAAAGGYVLYPNKHNINMIQYVYSK
jgi:hypothetical protein